MVHVIFPECGHVVEAMEQVRAKIRVGLALGHGVAHGAELLQRPAGRIRQGADDRLVGGILTAPVSAPFYHTSAEWCRGGSRNLTRLFTVAIGIVTAEQGITLVTIDDSLIVPNGLA